VRLLLDTHALLWALHEPHRLSPSLRARLNDPANAVYVSAASLWEITIKARIGKLDAEIDEITAQLAPASKLQPLAILPTHLAVLARLARCPEHNDPFDHLLLAQAIAEGMPLVTDDRHAPHYPVAIISCTGDAPGRK